MTPDWTPDILLAAVAIFLGFLSLAGYIARVWPADAPFGDYAELDRRWND